jgi:signal peptidase I
METEQPPIDPIVEPFHIASFCSVSERPAAEPEPVAVAEPQTDAIDSAPESIDQDPGAALEHASDGLEPGRTTSLDFGQESPEHGRTAPLDGTQDSPERSRNAPWVHLGQEVMAGVQTLVSAAVYATLIVTFGFQVARVDGLSMAPTLEDHDRLIVNKLVYELGEPRPGDIVMLYYPLNPEKMFVKRVIAKEGDTVRIVDGHVYVNDIPLRDDYVPAEFRSHDDWGPQVVQQGYYFVMGDHRNNSSDSRHWGPVPKKYIVGKVKVRWWPLQDARIF